MLLEPARRVGQHVVSNDVVMMHASQHVRQRYHQSRTVLAGSTMHHERAIAARECVEIAGEQVDEPRQVGRVGVVAQQELLIGRGLHVPCRHEAVPGL